MFTFVHLTTWDVFDLKCPCNNNGASIFFQSNFDDSLTTYYSLIGSLGEKLLRQPFTKCSIVLGTLFKQDTKCTMKERGVVSRDNFKDGNLF